MKAYTTQVINTSQFSYRVGRVISAVVLLAMICVSTTPSLATVLDLTEDGLGLKAGNYGTLLSIDESVQISAVTNKGKRSGPRTGTIYLGRGDKGLGVQTPAMKGSKGISGRGKNGYEILVFDFTENVSASSILIGLNKYRDCSDDSIISLSLSDGDELVFTKNHSNWDNATTSLGRGKVVVDIGLLLTENFTGLASSLSVAETSGHMYVNSITYHTPEPTTICMLGMGALALLRKRRK